MTRTILARAAGALAFGLVLVSGSFVRSAPQPCLPAPTCKDLACCTIPNMCLYLQGFAEAKAGRDFYATKGNRTKALDEAKRSICQKYITGGGGTWDGKGAIPEQCGYITRDSDITDNKAGRQITDDFKNYFKKRGDDFLKKKPCGQGPMTPMQVGWSTTDECKIEADGDPNAQDTCSEFLDAAKQHEEQHKAVCDALKGKDAAARQRVLAEFGGKNPRTTLDGVAEDERRAYAYETEVLRQTLRDAVHRCSVAKHQKASHIRELQGALSALAAQ